MSAIEGGVKYSYGGINATFAAYYRHGKNMIDWIMDTSLGEDAVWTSVNHTSINSTGLEANGNFDLRTLLSHQNILQAFDISYCYIDQTKKREENIQSLYALEYLRHKLVMSLRFHVISSLNGSISYRFQDRIGSYTSPEGINCNYKPYSVIDARLSWDKPSYNVFLNCNNITDTNYVDYGNVKQPGIWVVLGAKWKFGL